MKANSLKIFSLSILALVLLMSVVSATLTLSPSNLLRTTGIEHTIEITSNESGETFSLTSNPTVFTDSNGKTITISLSTSTLTYEVPAGFKFSGTESISVFGSISDPLTLSFENTPIPTGDVYADNQNLIVEIDDLSVENGFGPEDDEWYVLDEIKVKINVENNGDEDIKNILVQWGLYDEDAKEWVVKGKESKFKLNDGDDESLEVKFKIDSLNKIELDSDNYKFYAWATGEDTSDDEMTSSFDSNDITIYLDDAFVILDNLESQESASCGSDIQITADITNIGAEDQEDVYVRVYNKELGVNQKVIIGDIDSLDSESFEVTISIPKDVDEKQYDFLLSVYDEDSDLFENDNEDKSEFFVPITVDSCSTTPNVLVSAVSKSEKIISGEELIINALIENTGSRTATLNLELSDYVDWASLEDLSQSSITLDAGASEEVVITLRVNKGVSGDKSFNLILTEGEKVLTQPVSVTVEKASLFNFTGMFSGFTNGNNWYLWGIGALNVLLVLVIIIVAVKVTKKKVE